MNPEDAVHEAIIVFARQPQPGTSKTRLSPQLSPTQAAELYACFLKDTLAFVDRCRPVGEPAGRALDSAAARSSGLERFLAYDPPEAEPFFAALAPGYRLLAQSGSDLGERMHRAFTAVFSFGVRRAVMIGSDLPHLPTERLEVALAALRQGAGLVIGPSEDGGYYLAGLKEPHAELFDLPMGDSQVLSRTLDIAARLELQVVQLPDAFDVDDFAGLQRLERLLKEDSSIPAQHTRAWLSQHSL